MVLGGDKFSRAAEDTKTLHARDVIKILVWKCYYIIITIFSLILQYRYIRDPSSN